VQQKISIVHAAGITKLGARHAANEASVSVIFDEMSVTLPTDRICAVLGHPKSGRTTFLRLLSGLEHPDSGAILTDTRFSVIGNGGFFFHPALTGEENIRLAARAHGMEATMLMEIVLGFSKFGNCPPARCRAHAEGPWKCWLQRFCRMTAISLMTWNVQIPTFSRRFLKS
jgi:ABC-type polysaccharide/polyol phosphate transport system ATPase subunit